MSRRFVLLLAVCASLCLFAPPAWMTAARAADEATATETTGTTTEGTGTTETTGTTTEGTTTTTTEGTQPEAPKSDMPTKTAIRELALQGKAPEAEQAYLKWSTYWNSDDEALLVLAEKAMLQKTYKDGDFASLLALYSTGDREAKATLIDAVKNKGNEMAPADLVAALRVLGKSGDKTVAGSVLLFLHHNDDTVVNAAIEALGNLGSRTAMRDLLPLMEKADTPRAVLLAQTIDKLGGSYRLVDMLSPLLESKEDADRQKAALALAAISYDSGMTVLQEIAKAKDAATYPLLIGVLGQISMEGGDKMVSDALAAGSEAEQLAAMQSLSLLPAAKVDAQLFAIANDDKRPAAVRAAAIDLLAKRKPEGSDRVMRSLAFKGDETPPAVRAAALSNLNAFGVMNSVAVRTQVRIRLDNPDPDVARAARQALLRYALSPGKAKK